VTRRPSSAKSCVSHVKIFNRYFRGKRLIGVSIQNAQAFQTDQEVAQEVIFAVEN
jgi:hypothetical protein